MYSSVVCEKVFFFFWRQNVVCEKVDLPKFVLAFDAVLAMGILLSLNLTGI